MISLETEQVGSSLIMNVLLKTVFNNRLNLNTITFLTDSFPSYYFFDNESVGFTYFWLLLVGFPDHISRPSWDDCGLRLAAAVTLCVGAG